MHCDIRTLVLRPVFTVNKVDLQYFYLLHLLFSLPATFVNLNRTFLLYLPENFMPNRTVIFFFIAYRYRTHVLTYTSSLFSTGIM
jgi:hypothetical protein